MKIIVIFLLGLSSFTIATAQNSIAQKLVSNEYEAECGKPLSDGKVFDYREGKVTKIVDGNKIEFQQRDLNGEEKKATYLVQLAGVNSKDDNAGLLKFLKEKILGKNVMVAGNIMNDSDSAFAGSVWEANLGDVNQYILRNGITGYAESELKGVSLFTLCVSRRLAEKAKAERIGIWANR